MNKYIFRCVDTGTMHVFCLSLYANNYDEAIEKFYKNTRGCVAYTHIDEVN